MIDPKKDPMRRCLAPAAWPAWDQAAWIAAQAPGDVLDPGGVAAAWRPLTRRKTEKGYGRYLSWLGSTGALEAEGAITRRLTPALLAQYVRALQALNAPYTVLARVSELDMVARAIMPEADWAFLRHACSRLRSRVTGSRPKRSRIRPTHELLELGCRLMAGAEDEAAGTPRQRAVRYRDGLIIAFLAARPLRRRNFTALALGRHLLPTGDGWRILVPGKETKTGHRLEVPFPGFLAPALDRYLAAHRPVLARQDGRWHRPAGPALWLSADGSPMTEMALYDRIAGQTREAFGRSINPHLFRDCAATTLAIEDPEHVRIAAAILGHATFTTTERFYNLARNVEAARAWHAALAELRGRAVTSSRSVGACQATVRREASR